MFDALNREVYSGGEYVFNAGDEGDCAYLIEAGQVEIFVVHQGTERRLSLMGKGELFGEVALVDYRPRTASVRATQATVLVPIPRKLMEGLLEKTDPILRHLLLVILDRFRGQLDNTVSAEVDAELRAKLERRRDALKGEVTQKISLSHGMTRALAQDEFQLYYQPICDLADNRVAGFEALIRWAHPVDGLMPPLDFLWIAEQTGQIRDIGLWVLERACRDWPRLRRMTEVDKPFISVNLAAQQLSDERLVDDVRSILATEHMKPEELKLELTETAMVENPELAFKILGRLIALGSSIALDDYGTGHSGLGHLQRYPIATLKIDRTFIAPMLESAQSLEIVRSSVALAHSLGMSVVAEGIETEAIRAMLIDMKCDYGQGWHFGKASALAQLESRGVVV